NRRRLEGQILGFRVGTLAYAGQASVGTCGLAKPAGRDAWRNHIDRPAVATPFAVKLNPTSLLQACHAFHDLIRDPGPADHRAALVVQLDKIAIVDAIGLRI